MVGIGFRKSVSLAQKLRSEEGIIDEIHQEVGARRLVPALAATEALRHMF